MNPRMKVHPLALASALATLCIHPPLLAQAEVKNPPDSTASKKLDAVEVIGIRASLQRSIDAKKQADTNIEVISAEDVGKMPDKNVGDALSRVPGVNVQAGNALAMDEAERVAIRSVPPSLNLFTVNGHAISSGDWHISDQGSSTRSVSFALLPSQLIGQVTVFKNGQADVIEGGISGSVDMKLRKPLDFKKPLVGEVSLGAAYSDRAGEVDPQLSGLLSWQNEARSLGVLIQAFSEKRHIQRDAAETFSRGFFNQAGATASGDASLVNVRFPANFNAASFQGVRERKGAYLGVQVRPTRDTDLHLSAFSARLDAENFNKAPYVTVNGMIGTVTSGAYRVSDAKLDGGVLTEATLTRPANATAMTQGLMVDQLLRDGAHSTSQFLNLEGEHRFSDRFIVKGLIGTTRGDGITEAQPYIKLGLINPHQFKYKIFPDKGPEYAFYDAAGKQIDLADMKNYRLVQERTNAPKSLDKEDYLHVDGEHRVEWGPLNLLKFGLRVTQHQRDFSQNLIYWKAERDGGYSQIGLSSGNSLPLINGVAPALPTPEGSFPADQGKGLGGNYASAYPFFSEDQIRAFNAQYLYQDPANINWTGAYTIKEDNQAAYLMSEFELDRWSGNFGVRGVRTKVTSISYQRLGAFGCDATTPRCRADGAFTTNAQVNGVFLPQVVETTHNVFLPSLNARYQFNKDLIGRFSLNRTMGRPNYGELAGAVSLTNEDISKGPLTATATGNPSLKPTVSDNIDVSLGWYFAPRAFVSGALFQQRMKNYPGRGRADLPLFNPLTNKVELFDTATRVGVDASVKGLEIAGELPIGAGFGIGANYTFVDAADDSFTPAQPMISSSKHTYNLVGFYETQGFSVRMAWNHRSAFQWVQVASSPHNIQRWADGVGSLSASVNLKLTDTISLSLDGNNLNNPRRKYYHDGLEQLPQGYFLTGRQYYLNLRAKF